MFNGEGEYLCHSGDSYVGNFVNGKPGQLGSRGETGKGEVLTLLAFLVQK
jgi:hypothetical protein